MLIEVPTTKHLESILCLSRLRVDYLAKTDFQTIFQCFEVFQILFKSKLRISKHYFMMIMARTRVFDFLDDFNNFAYNLSDLKYSKNNILIFFFFRGFFLV